MGWEEIIAIDIKSIVMNSFCKNKWVERERGREKYFDIEELQTFVHNR